MAGSYKRGKHRIELRLKLFVYVEVVGMAGGGAASSRAVAGCWLAMIGFITSLVMGH